MLCNSVLAKLYFTIYDVLRTHVPKNPSWENNPHLLVHQPAPTSLQNSLICANGQFRRMKTRDPVFSNSFIYWISFIKSVASHCLYSRHSEDRRCRTEAVMGRSECGLSGAHCCWSCWFLPSQFFPVPSSLFWLYRSDRGRVIGLSLTPIVTCWQKSQSGGSTHALTHTLEHTRPPTPDADNSCCYCGGAGTLLDRPDSSHQL